MWVRSAATPPAEDCQTFPFLSPSPRFSEWKVWFLGGEARGWLRRSWTVSVLSHIISQELFPYCSRLNAWLFLSHICNGTKEKCIQQPYGSTCHSGTTAAGCSCEQRQEKKLSKLTVTPLVWKAAAQIPGHLCGREMRWRPSPKHEA